MRPSAAQEDGLFWDDAENLAWVLCAHCGIWGLFQSIDGLLFVCRLVREERLLYARVRQ